MTSLQTVRDSNRSIACLRPIAKALSRPPPDPRSPRRLRRCGQSAVSGRSRSRLLFDRFRPPSGRDSGRTETGRQLALRTRRRFRKHPRHPQTSQLCHQLAPKSVQSGHWPALAIGKARRPLLSPNPPTRPALLRPWALFALNAGLPTQAVVARTRVAICPGYKFVPGTPIPSPPGEAEGCKFKQRRDLLLACFLRFLQVAGATSRSLASRTRNGCLMRHSNSETAATQGRACGPPIR